MPPAPPTFSMITCWSRSSERRAPRIRPTVSEALPAANGMTMVTGRVGQSSAAADHDEIEANAANAADEKKQPMTADGIMKIEAASTSNPKRTKIKKQHKRFSKC